MIPPPARSPKILAGVDIGTLTCRLLIAEISSAAHLRELKSDRRILRLGQGVDRHRRLRVDAMDRVIAVLSEWRLEIETLGVEAVAVVATSAVRDAENRDEFLDRVKREAGFEVELISGEEEARRAMLGIRSGLPPGVTDVLALDIGGGSTEFILDRPGHGAVIRSIDIGVVRLSERMLHHDPPTREEIGQAGDWVRTEVAGAVPDMPHPGITVVGTAGTITSLAAMAQELPAYERGRIQNYRLSLKRIKELERRLLDRSTAERIGMPGLERGREEVIVAGAVMLRTTMTVLGCDELLVSDLGLREGVLIDLANKVKQQ